MTWSAYRFSPRLRSRCGFLRQLARLLDLRVDFGELDLGEALTRLTASPSCTWMRRTTPPILNDRRISSLLATMPLVSIGGTAGPWLAAATRTGVGFAASGRLAPAAAGEQRGQRHDGDDESTRE